MYISRKLFRKFFFLIVLLYIYIYIYIYIHVYIYNFITSVDDFLGNLEFEAETHLSLLTLPSNIRALTIPELFSQLALTSKLCLPYFQKLKCYTLGK